MSETLYELNSAYQNLLAEVRAYAEEHGGEITPEMGMQLDAVEMSRDAKIEANLRYWKNENAIAETIDREILALQKRSATHGNNAGWMKDYLAQIVKPGEKVEYAVGRISWRKSTSVNVVDPAKVPAQYQRVIPERREPDKNAIGDALKAGQEVDGCELVTKP